MVLPGSRIFFRHTGSLVVALALLSSLAAAPRASPSAPPAAAAGSPSLQERIDPENPDVTHLAAAIFYETNRVRAQLNLPLFDWLAQLDEAANLQANSSALSQTSGHVNMFPSLTYPIDRVRHVGLKARMVGENVAIIPLLQFNPAHGYYERKENGETVFRDGSTDQVIPPHTYASFAAAVVDAWMKSPGHRASIVNPDFRYLGCSSRTSRSMSGLQMAACVQVFFTPFGHRP